MPPRAHLPPARSAEANSPGKQHLGQKLSILYRIEDSDHPFNEVVGLLQRVENEDDGAYDTLMILRKSGELVEVGAEQIVSWKVLPQVQNRSS